MLWYFNPIPAGVLKNQDTPLLNPMFDIQKWQMIHNWKALILYFNPIKAEVYFLILIQI